MPSGLVSLLIPQRLLGEPDKHLYHLRRGKVNLRRLDLLLHPFLEGYIGFVGVPGWSAASLPLLTKDGVKSVEADYSNASGFPASV